MELKLLCLFFVFLVVKVYGHPMMYRLNENKNLEPDFVPVSSTVIPLPIYKVGYTVHAYSTDEKQKTFSKPEGPIMLITAKSKNKKPIPKEKTKDSSTSKITNS